MDGQTEVINSNLRIANCNQKPQSFTFLFSYVAIAELEVCLPNKLEDVFNSQNLVPKFNHPKAIIWLSLTLSKL